MWTWLRCLCDAAFLLRSWLYLVTCGFNTHLVNIQTSGIHSSMLEYVHDTSAASLFVRLKRVSVTAVHQHRHIMIPSRTIVELVEPKDPSTWMISHFCRDLHFRFSVRSWNWWDYPELKTQRLMIWKTTVWVCVHAGSGFPPADWWPETRLFSPVC